MLWSISPWSRGGRRSVRTVGERAGETETRVKELIERADGVLELRDLNA